MPTRNNLSRIVLTLWVFVALAVGGTILLVVNGTLLVQSANNHSPTVSASQTFTPLPSPTFQPTLTPPPATPTKIPPSLTPVLNEPQIIGTSVAGRDLQVYQFGDGPTEKMIVAGIHGGYEWNTIILADELIEYLSNHPEVIPADHTLFILRALNPDGFERTKGIRGRANDNNVDINRNFPFNWQIEWPRSGCWDYIPITGGPSAASEPETQALMAFVDDHEIIALISYHSAALGIFPGGQPADPASISLAETIAAVSDYPYPPYDLGCMFTGQMADWLSDQGIAAVDIELTNHEHTDFEKNLAILSVFLDWEYPEISY